MLHAQTGAAFIPIYSATLSGAEGGKVKGYAQSARINGVRF